LAGIVLFIIWTFIWFDSARRYVHAGLADQLIEMRLEEHKVVLKALSDLESGETDKSEKRLNILLSIYEEELVLLSQAIESDGTWIERLTISRENMEKLRQFVKTPSIKITIASEK